jgi:hypothetical protein
MISNVACANEVFCHKQKFIDFQVMKMGIGDWGWGMGAEERDRMVREIRRNRLAEEQ